MATLCSLRMIWEVMRLVCVACAMPIPGCLGPAARAHSPAASRTHEPLLPLLSARKIWDRHFTDVDAIIYLVDAADRERIPEAKRELDVRGKLLPPAGSLCYTAHVPHAIICVISQHLITHPALESVPFLVLGNKIDRRDALTEQELRATLNLTQTTGKDVTSATEGVRPLELFVCSVVKRTGYDKGFNWLNNFL